MSSKSPAIAFSKDAFLNRRRIVAARIKSFSLPKRAQNPDRVRHDHASRDCLLRKSSSAISGFRSLCGREQHSPSYCARLDLRFGTFHSVGSRFENSGLHPLLPTGPATLDRCCGRNVVAPGEYSKGFFCVPIGLYRGIFRPATARAMPARSALGAPAGVNPSAAIKRWTWPLWPSPASTTNAAPGARRQAACGMSVR
jgi:hypothetical protein